MNCILWPIEGTMKTGGNGTSHSLHILVFLVLFPGEDAACCSFSCRDEWLYLLNLERELARELIQLCYFHRHKSGRNSTAPACLSETLKPFLTNVHPLLSLK